MILVTGANGQLGQCFRQLMAGRSEQEVFFAGSAELDIADKKAVAAFFKQHPVRWCINCAAYTAVDKAEQEPEQARRINVDGARNLARACADTGALMVHFSTDYVYHNHQNRPFIETDVVSPKGVYARTKRSGERAVQKVLPSAMIIRTSWVYSAFGNNFVKTMLRLGAERPELKVVFDQIGTPTYAPDLAAAVLEIMEKTADPATAIAGIWHYSNEGVCSWYDFAQAIMDLRGLPCKVWPIESREYPTPAQRPPFSVLNKQKIRSAFGLQIPYWRKSLEICLREIG